ncbi:MAG: diaminopimelate epimerase [Kiloniellales bacterium]
MSGLSFIKMHGLGNDFVIIDGRDAPVAITADHARAIADRRTGVGCDQLIVLERAKANGAGVFMRIRNADGGVTAACGNAARCVAALLMEESGEDRARIETEAGVLAAQRKDGGVMLDFGPARFEWRDIPLSEAADTLHLPIEMGPLRDPAACSMGNPHATFFVDDAEAVDLEALGPALEHHEMFPERANIGIAQVIGPGEIRLRVWERGAGVTRACGTGASAAVVSGHRRGLIGRQVRTILDGGSLMIEWRQSDGHVLMTGPVAVSFTATLDPSLLSAAGAR